MGVRLLLLGGLSETILPCIFTLQRPQSHLPSLSLSLSLSLSSHICKSMLLPALIHALLLLPGPLPYKSCWYPNKEMAGPIEFCLSLSWPVLISISAPHTCVEINPHWQPAFDMLALNLLLTFIHLMSGFHANLVK